MSVARRVVARWLIRQAGLFDPPPKMVEKVGAWMADTFAGHVWAQTETRLVRLQGARVEAEEALQELDKFRRKLPKQIERAKAKGPSKPGKATTIRFRLPDPTPVSLTVEVQFEPAGGFSGLAFSLTAWGKKTGWINVERLDKLDAFFDAVQKRIERTRDNPGLLQEGLSQNRRKEVKNLWVEYQLLIKECQKYASAPKEYKSKASKKFKVDVSGWRYPMTDDQMKWAMTIMPTIIAQLKFEPRKKTLGTWDGMSHTLVIDINSSPQSVARFKSVMADLRDTLIHELSHMGQSFLGYANPGAGTPSKNITDPEYTPWGEKRQPMGPGMVYDPTRQEYLLRGVEFYPWVRDNISEFLRLVKKIRQDDRADAARIWVGESPQDHTGPALNAWRLRTPRKLWNVNVHFKALKDKAPKMWEKAVKEFYKGVQQAL